MPFRAMKKNCESTEVYYLADRCAWINNNVESGSEKFNSKWHD